MAGQPRKSAPAKSRSSPAGEGAKGGKKPRATEPAPAATKSGRGAGVSKKRKTEDEEEEEEGSEDEKEVRKKKKRGAAAAAVSKIKRQEDEEEDEDGHGGVEEDEEGEEEDGVGMEVTQTPAMDMTKYHQQMDKFRKKKDNSKAQESMKKLQAIFTEMDEEMSMDAAEGIRTRIDEVTATYEKSLQEFAARTEKLEALVKNRNRPWRDMEAPCGAYWNDGHKKLEQVLGVAIAGFEERVTKIEEVKTEFSATQAALLATGAERIQKSLDSKSIAHRARKFILA